VTKRLLLPEDPFLSKYARVQKWLEAQLQNGTFRPGDRLPGESKLSKTLGFSTVTIRQAFQALTNQGLLIRSPYRGTFVAKPPSNPSSPSTVQIEPKTALQLRGKILVLVGHLKMPDSGRYRQRQILEAFEKKLSPSQLQCTIKYLYRDDEINILEPGEDQSYCAAFLLADMLTQAQQTSVALQLRTAGIPLLSSDYNGEIPVHRVQESIAMGVDLALEHLACLGHSRVGFLTFNTNESWGSQLPWLEQRRTGFLHGAQQRQWPNPESLIWPVSLASLSGVKKIAALQKEAGAHIAERFVASGGVQQCTALVAVNDDVAMGFVAAMRRHHPEMLKQLSLIGFDNTPEAQMASLTTVVSPTHEMATAAAKMILGFLEDGVPHEYRSVEYQPHLLARSSTHPLPVKME
jgi:DNA-binding LacI/PurR family transcriptional regulator/biotin operon repressor